MTPAHRSASKLRLRLRLVQFAALDYLPRAAFLGEIIHQARSAEIGRQALSDAVESATVDVLPGDVRPTLFDGRQANWMVQPDVIIDSPEALCVIEAKCIKSSSFQRHQIARSLVVTEHLAAGRPSVLLLLGKEPPVRVQKAGVDYVVEYFDDRHRPGKHVSVAERLGPSVNRTDRWLYCSSD